MVMPILTKEQFYEAWIAGRLGNKVRTWRNLDELEASGYQGLITIRYLVPMATNCKYSILAENARIICNSLVKEFKLDLSKFFFNESANDDHLLIQGELTRLHDGLYFYYSRIKDKMRPSLQRGGISIERLQAKMILQGNVDPSSYEDLMYFLDTYEDHVIEFSTYSDYVGNIPHRNTVVWEVRRY